MKKFLPPIILVMGFCGFLAAQILWDVSHLNAQQIHQEQTHDQMFESLFNELKVTTIDSKIIEPKTLSTPIVVVNFWASWCLPCLKEFPSLVEFQKKFGSNVSVIGINGDEEDSEKMIEKTKSKYNLDFYHVADPQSTISDKFLVSSYPFSLVYVKGKIQYVAKKNLNFMDKDFLNKIESALKGK
ncbi:MAG: redoxin domain-containing protein [Bacteriovoracaceae bacterium]|nr:redoxin domain-containing protein [Bacteriovoracaceae bacterium]